MKYELLKRSHIKRNIIIGIVVVLVLSAVVLTFTRAKYRTTQSMPLIQGTINFSPSDFNVLALYLNKGTETISADKAPHVGYTLNTEQSTCEVNDIDAGGEIVYEDGNLSFMNMNYKGTKCSVYFDLIPDNEDPIIESVTIGSDDTSITATVNATDNIGIFYYYFKLDNGEEIRSENATYTFNELIKGDEHTINIRVEDAAGNNVSSSKKATVGLTATDVILAQEGGAATVEAKGTPDFSQTATTDEGMYAAEDDYGTSYYYRGAVNDNWFQFGGYYWRIIRINGDGTIRLIFNGTTSNQEAKDATISEGVDYGYITDNAYVGYMYKENEVHGLEQDNQIKIVVDNWFSSNLISYEKYLDGSTGFCGDRTPSTSSSISNGLGGTGKTETFYGAYIRLTTNKNPVLTCYDDRDLYTTNSANGNLIGSGNQSLTYPIGLITADEIAMAGGVNGISNDSFYLNFKNNAFYWTMTPAGFGHLWSNTTNYAFMYICSTSDSLYNDYYAPYTTAAVRPVINIRADVELTGSGTTSDPFKIVGAS